MKLIVKDLKGNDSSEHEVRFTLIDNNKGSQSVHDVVVAYQAAQRMGTACTKTMGDVAGSGRKPWRQKGTGRARAGSFASPLWRGGGVVFGPKPRDFGFKVPRSARQLAFRKAVSDRLKTGDVQIVDELTVPSAKTKDFIKILANLKMTGTILVVTSAVDALVQRASRNVPGVDLTTGKSLNTYQVLRFDKLLFTRSAFTEMEQRLLQP
jgi:large subunit ribosomal protein L4